MLDILDGDITNIFLEFFGRRGCLLVGRKQEEMVGEVRGKHCILYLEGQWVEWP